MSADEHARLYARACCMLRCQCMFLWLAGCAGYQGGDAASESGVQAPRSRRAAQALGRAAREFSHMLSNSAPPQGGHSAALQKAEAVQGLLTLIGLLTVHFFGNLHTGHIPEQSMLPAPVVLGRTVALVVCMLG
jgi:hypothetical protein